jgi:hypothetical protein
VDEDREIDWETFKSDVNLKNLVSHIDRGVDRRSRLKIENLEKYNIEHTDEEQIYKIKNCMKWYKRLHPIHSISLLLYIFGCFFERPAWCIQNDPEKVPGMAVVGYTVAESGVDYWFCRSENPS